MFVSTCASTGSVFGSCPKPPTFRFISLLDTVPNNESRTFRRAAFYVLQLLPDSSLAALDTSDGSGRDRSRLVNRGGHQLIVRNPAKKEGQFLPRIRQGTVRGTHGRGVGCNRELWGEWAAA